MGIMDYVENFLGHLFSSFKGRDAKLFTKGPAFANCPTPTYTITSPELGETGSSLKVAHTPMGENKFPELSWPTVTADQKIKEYLLVVEDPDAPLPVPIAHGVFYSIPASLNGLTNANFEPIESKSPGSNNVKGGFKYGKNRAETIFRGARPILGHGSHRYFFQLVGLTEALDTTKLSAIATREELGEAIVGKVEGWGVWIANYERKWDNK